MNKMKKKKKWEGNVFEGKKDDYKSPNDWLFPCFDRPSWVGMSLMSRT